MNMRPLPLTLLILAFSALAGCKPDTPPAPPPAADDDNMRMCTQEVKTCPDGSYVGRSGPNCEFAACPDGSQPK
jgi:hypothetical protein